MSDYKINQQKHNTITQRSTDAFCKGSNSQMSEQLKNATSEPIVLIWKAQTRNNTPFF